MSWSILLFFFLFFSCGPSQDAQKKALVSYQKSWNPFEKRVQTQFLWASFHPTSSKMACFYTSQTTLSKDHIDKGGIKIPTELFALSKPLFPHFMTLEQIEKEINAYANAEYRQHFWKRVATVSASSAATASTLIGALSVLTGPVGPFVFLAGSAAVGAASAGYTYLRENPNQLSNKVAQSQTSVFGLDNHTKIEEKERLHIINALKDRPYSKPSCCQQNNCPDPAFCQETPCQAPFEIHSLLLLFPTLKWNWSSLDLKGSCEEQSSKEVEKIIQQPLLQFLSSEEKNLLQKMLKNECQLSQSNQQTPADCPLLSCRKCSQCRLCGDDANCRQNYQCHTRGGTCSHKNFLSCMEQGIQKGCPGYSDFLLPLQEMAKYLPSSEK